VVVLLVEDFADVREMYAQYLRFAGFTVEEASRGDEAIERARVVRPTIVVMDMSLPVLTGWEATRIMKADPRLRAIPVVALTAHALEGESAKAREAGCDRFVAKPCLPADLVKILAEVLDRTAKRSERRLRRRDPPS
jgi:CheY-like chemotaxis protein